MRDIRKRLALLGVLALAVGVCAGTGVAQAAKVTETAAGGPVPNATGGPGLATGAGVFTQTFELKGGKVKNKQILDVNLTMSSFGNTGDVNDDLTATLISPKGENADVPTPFQGSSFTNLKFDDQSPLQQYCNPFTFVAPFCNFIIGATPPPGGTTDFGFFTGTIDAGLYAFNTAAGFNPVFKGGNPKGTWTLKVYDVAPNAAGSPQTALLGTSELEVKTGKKFAKD